MMIEIAPTVPFYKVEHAFQQAGLALRSNPAAGAKQTDLEELLGEALEQQPVTLDADNIAEIEENIATEPDYYALPGHHYGDAESGAGADPKVESAISAWLTRRPSCSNND